MYAHGFVPTTTRRTTLRRSFGTLTALGYRHFPKNEPGKDQVATTTTTTTVVVSDGTKSALPSKSVMLKPVPYSIKDTTTKHTALVLLPGCLLEPTQYTALAQALHAEIAALQNQNNDNEQVALWVVIPKLPWNMANHLTVGPSVRQAIQALRQAGYPTTAAEGDDNDGDNIFVGGHSLGGIFLPNLLQDDRTILGEERIAGLVQLGSFIGRAHRKKASTTATQERDTSRGSDSTSSTLFDKTPRLILNGDLDGLIRVSRIAEDYHNHVIREGNTEEAKLHHSVVLVPGMVRLYMCIGNHFHLFNDLATSLFILFVAL